MRKVKPLVERFCLHYKIQDSGCWLWTARINQKGYGIMGISGAKKIRAHRMSYFLFKGDIPSGLNVCHKCDNRWCVNPDHLFLGTQQDNIDDKCNKNRQQKGEGVPNSKLNPISVKVIREAFSHGHRQPAIARYFGISQSSVSLVVLRKNWAHV